MSEHLKINTIIIDALDPDRLATFWSAVLARPVAGRTGPYVWLQRVHGLGVGFQTVLDAKTNKNRLHFDLESDDPANEHHRIESLGGRRLTQYQAGGFLVMADPEGNEFCIIPKGPFDVDDGGRANYLVTP